MLEIDEYSSEEDASANADVLYQLIEVNYKHLIAAEMILDIGCGKGHLLRAMGLKFPNAQLIGVDVNRYMQKFAAQIVPQAQIFHASIVDIPIDSNSVTIATSTLLFDHSEFGMPRWQTFMTVDLAREIMRILVPGGIYVPMSEVVCQDIAPIFESCGMLINTRTVDPIMEKPY